VGQVSSGSNGSWVVSGRSHGLCMGQVFSGSNGRGPCSVGHMGYVWVKCTVDKISRGSRVQWVKLVVGRVR